MMVKCLICYACHSGGNDMWLSHAVAMNVLQDVALDEAPQFQMFLHPQQLEPPAIPQEEHLRTTQLHKSFQS